MPTRRNEGSKIHLLPLEVTIRPAQDEDEDFLISLSARVFRVYAHDAASAMRRMMRNGKNAIAVAEHNETRIGFAVVAVEALGRDYGPLQRPSVAHLDAIAVRPNMSGQGVGHRLLAYAENLARKRGAVSMSLMTAETNIDAQRLFRSAGFHVVATFDEVYLGSQRGLTMIKAL